MLVLKTRLEAFMAHTCQLRLFKPWAALHLCVSRADFFFSARSGIRRCCSAESDVGSFLLAQVDERAVTAAQLNCINGLGDVCGHCRRRALQI